MGAEGGKLWSGSKNKNKINKQEQGRGQAGTNLKASALLGCFYSVRWCYASLERRKLTSNPNPNQPLTMNYKNDMLGQSGSLVQRQKC